MPKDAPSRRKLWPGRTGEPCRGEKQLRLGLGHRLTETLFPSLFSTADTRRTHGQRMLRRFLRPPVLRPAGSHLVRQAGQQVEHEVSHPLNELLQGLQRGHLQDKLLCLQVDHHLVNV